MLDTAKNARYNIAMKTAKAPQDHGYPAVPFCFSRSPSVRRGKHEERKLSEKSEDKPMSTVTEIFGSMVFNDHVMKERLPKETYKAMQKTIRDGSPALT